MEKNISSCVMVCVLVFVVAVNVNVFVAGRSVPGEAGETKKCELFYFYDLGTDRCEPCSDVCDHADIKNTEKECQRDCSEYHVSQQCTSDKYYDEKTGTCSPCGELCQHHDIRVTTLQCQTLCPNYHPEEIIEKEGNDNLKVDTILSTALSLPKAEDPKVDNPGTSQSRHLIWIIPLVAVLIIFVTVVLAVVVIVSRRIHRQPIVVKYDRASVTDSDSDKGTCSGIKESVPLRYPEAETQPGINSQLAASGT